MNEPITTQAQIQVRCAITGHPTQLTFTRADNSEDVRITVAGTFDTGVLAKAGALHLAVLGVTTQPSTHN
jgi:hypothetical protein